MNTIFRDTAKKLKQQIITLTFFALMPVMALAATLSDGLVAHYKFDGNASSIGTFGEWLEKLIRYESWHTGDLANYVGEAKTAYTKAPTDYKARIEHAITTLMVTAEDPVVAKYAKTFGVTLNYFTLDATVEKEYEIGASTPAINDMVDDAAKILRPALVSAIADLDAIPSNWTGTVTISPADYPIDETVYVDSADVLTAKAMLKTALAQLDTLRAYDNKMDWPLLHDFQTSDSAKGLLPIVMLDDEPTCDSVLWERTTHMREKDGADASVARWDTNLYVRIVVPETGSQTTSVIFGIKVRFADGTEGGISAGWSGTYPMYQVWKEKDYSGVPMSGSFIWNVSGQNVIWIKIPLPKTIDLTNLKWKELWVYLGGYGGEFEFWYDCAAKAGYHFLYEQKGLMAGVRNQSVLTDARAEMISAIDLVLAADEKLRNAGRLCDGKMHVFESEWYDSDSMTSKQIAKVREWVGKLRASLNAEQQDFDAQTIANELETVFDVENNDAVLDDVCALLPNNGNLRVCLSALYSGTFTRALLPQARLKQDTGRFTDLVPTVETLPDATFGGLLPQVGLDHWSTILEKFAPDYVEHLVDYRVQFDKNGGCGSMQTIYGCKVGSVYKLPKNTFTNGTRKFAGWKGSDGKRYDDEILFFNLRTSTENKGKVAMKAIWE